MNMTVNALKNVYAAMGGNLDDVKNVATIPEMINAITTLVDGNDATFEELKRMKWNAIKNKTWGEILKGE